MALLKQIVSREEHSLGAENPKIRIIEYGDFQCPLSRAAEPVIRGLLREFGQQISFTFRNYPLLNDHPYAFDAACAVEAAGKQGKYWEMHQAVMANQANLSDDLFMKLSENLGLNDIRFVTDSISKDVHYKINTDFRLGTESGLTTTPAFFIDGKRFYGCAADLYVLISIILED
ncbi:DsbA family protein [Mucilaginibacter pallidiroseus]|uniref:DsbA family protein n=1 Tax=Mucilaginibacter pallidiroseus TaxID=2599295 RepID=A0A563U4Q9_9SPHI|nr:thioredoxin domain-containing protein [Mucilaginibacter pallidiroseus]TWR26340.1 DsbA family protein [Mucilaginibacter pallidiroseus]